MVQHYITNIKSTIKAIKVLTLTLLLLAFAFPNNTVAQISNDGCVSGKFGIDSGLYSGVIEYGAGTPATGSNDWFVGTSGRGIIDETNVAALRTTLQTQANPLYERRMKYNLVSIHDNQILIDAIFARDYFGGTGDRDDTSYNTASKNGEDPALWDIGTANVLGKNDIIDVGGHMFRDGLGNTSNLWFTGFINMAEPGGTAYMDFEFYVAGVTLKPKGGGGFQFDSGGPQLGHTAYEFDNATGDIKKIGDFIFSVALTGQTTVVETRLWVKKTDLLKTPSKFDWTGTFDGAYNNALYGYAGIKPKVGSPPEICGYVNGDNQTPLGPPWGTKTGKENSWRTNYGPNAAAELAINLTALGIDHASLSGADPCYFPLNTFLVKSRASDSFTAQLKDFAGPYKWGQPINGAVIVGQPLISCDNPTPQLRADPTRGDVTYSWSTIDGHIVGSANQSLITVDKKGTYTLHSVLPTNCPMEDINVFVDYDPTKPFFVTPVLTSSTTSCNGNDGVINATVTGGTAPYTFTWTKDGSPYTITNSANGTVQLTNLTPGTYRAIIKGVYACETATAQIIIAAKTPITVTPSITDVKCYDYSTGAINLTISGGKAPLTYMWSTGNTSQNLTNVKAGNYSVTITDGDGCTTIGNYTINQAAAFTATIAKTNDTDPNLAIGNGTATATISGGVAPYTYSWSGPSGFTSTNKDITGLKYGNYILTVTDANMCATTASVLINEPEICNDTVDNDGDGLVDCADGNCTPPGPGTITASSASPCIGDAVSYTVAVNPIYDSYQWSVPANATILSGQGTNSISIKWDTTAGGQICISGKKYNCLSPTSCINVDVSTKPLGAGAIIVN